VLIPRALRFDNRLVRELPVEPLQQNRTRQVFGACFSRVRPTPVAAPRTVAVAQEVAELLELTPEFTASQEFAEVFSGNRLLPGMDAVSACYGGHQFGNWAGQLGDGRAITLGEVENARGEYWEIQLKGAGPTPYSRHADGRAVLRSSVREFLCSEAMFHLGVPTTRALSLVATGDKVVRDILYDGHPREEPSAIVCRVSPSFLRFGNFELFAAREEHELLKTLTDFTLRTYFKELGEPSRETYVELMREVSRRTGELIAHWMAVGFVHGVMNTDNMSILGLTIDYGPYGFLDHFDPDFTPNITDRHGRRYRYANQPSVALWNLSRLAQALTPLVGDQAPLKAALGEYLSSFQNAERRRTAEKLGIRELSDDETSASGAARLPDTMWVGELYQLLAEVETDVTIFFRKLADVRVDENVPARTQLGVLESAFYDPTALSEDYRARFAAWLERYVARVREDGVRDAERRAAMNRVNPKYILRNYVAQLAIDRAEAGDDSVVHELLEVFRKPFDEQPDKERYAEKRPDWARDRAGCSMLSCSS
jgi:uncharacterized protein YdiU (UPF0061 family)